VLLGRGGIIGYGEESALWDCYCGAVGSAVEFSIGPVVESDKEVAAGRKADGEGAESSELVLAVGYRGQGLRPGAMGGLLLRAHGIGELTIEFH
jgi:hypothetical protein